MSGIPYQYFRMTISKSETEYPFLSLVVGVLVLLIKPAVVYRFRRLKETTDYRTKHTSIYCFSMFCVIQFLFLSMLMIRVRGFELNVFADHRPFHTHPQCVGPI